VREIVQSRQSARRAAGEHWKSLYEAARKLLCDLPGHATEEVVVVEKPLGRLAQRRVCRSTEARRPWACSRERASVGASRKSAAGRRGRSIARCDAARDRAPCSSASACVA
jgi:hypothetical protein